MVDLLLFFKIYEHINLMIKGTTFLIFFFFEKEVIAYKISSTKK